MNLITDYIISLSTLYGIVHKEKVAEIYNMQNEDEVSLAQIELMMENEQAMLEKYFVIVDGNYFIYETIITFNEFDSYMTQKAGKPYYIPKKDELLKYKDQFYFEKTKEYQVLVDYIAREFVEGDRERATELAEDIQGLCHVEASPTTMLDNMSSDVDFNSEEQIHKIMDLVINLGNNRRLWSNNGYTPRELFETHEKQHLRPLPDDNRIAFSQRDTYNETKKIGRNDPCPCGSGKSIRNVVYNLNASACHLSGYTTY